MAGRDKVAVRKVGAFDNVGVVGAANEAVFARKFVDELHGSMIGAPLRYCQEKARR